MFSNLIFKGLYDKRWFIVGWSLGVMAMAALTVAFFPTLAKQNVEQLFQNVPKQFQGLIGDAAAYSTIKGYIANGVFELRVPMLTIPMVIILATGLGVGEETSGQLYQLLAQPISRARIVLEKWLTMLKVTLSVHLALLAGLLLVTLAIHEHMAFGQLVPLVFMCLLLSLAVGSLALMFGLGTGKKGIATALIALLAFGSYLITSFANQIDWLKKVDYLSLFHYYHPSMVAKTGLSLNHIAVLASVSIVALTITMVGFSNRDIGV